MTDRDPFMVWPGARADLTRFKDGRIMCQICFGYFHVEQLHEIGPGIHEDVCAGCARGERIQLLARVLAGLRALT